MEDVDFGLPLSCLMLLITLYFRYAGAVDRHTSFDLNEIGDEASSCSLFDLESVQRSKGGICSSTSEVKATRTKGSRSKYPELYKLMLSDPDAVQLDYSDKNVIAQLDDKTLPIDIVELPSFTSDDVSESDPTSANDTMGGEAKVTQYARLKARAVAEGKLDEFIDYNRAKSQRFRDARQDQEKKAVGRYEYACRRMKQKTLEINDPVEAKRQEEAKRLLNRERSKAYYHANKDKERIRSSIYRQAKKLSKQKARPEEAATRRIVRDFNLNDPALGDDGFSEGDDACQDEPVPEL